MTPSEADSPALCRAAFSHVNIYQLFVFRRFFSRCRYALTVKAEYTPKHQHKNKHYCCSYRRYWKCCRVHGTVRNCYIGHVRRKLTRSTIILFTVYAYKVIVIGLYHVILHAVVHDILTDKLLLREICEGLV